MKVETLREVSCSGVYLIHRNKKKSLISVPIAWFYIALPNIWMHFVPQQLP